MRNGLIILIFIFSSCGNLGTISTDKKTPTRTIYLDGSESYDPDGWIVGYFWRQVFGETVQIKSNRKVITTVSLKKKGLYKFELTATDNQGVTGKDTAVYKY